MYLSVLRRAFYVSEECHGFSNRIKWQSHDSSTIYDARASPKTKKKNDGANPKAFCFSPQVKSGSQKPLNILTIPVAAGSDQHRVLSGCR